MCVRETAFTLVCFYDLAKLAPIDSVTSTGEISRLIVAPQLIFWQCFYLICEGI